MAKPRLDPKAMHFAKRFISACTPTYVRSLGAGEPNDASAAAQDGAAHVAMDQHT
jgi:hypothetical protein